MATTDYTLERGLPASVEAERCILGSILLDNLTYFDASARLRPDDFSLDSHRRIYARISDLLEATRPVDIITLSEELRQQQQLEAVGGVAYLASLTEGLPRRASISHHVKIVKDKALLRNLVHAANASVARAFEQSEPVEDIIGGLETALWELSEETISTGFRSIPEIVKGSFGSIDELYTRGQEVTGLRTHYPDLDHLTSGLQPADLIIIAARPSMGKTAFAMNIAENAAVLDNKLVGIFSLEMSAESLLMRILAAHSRVDSHRLRTGFIAKEDRQRLTQALSRLLDAPIFVDDTAGIALHEMRAKARRLKHAQGRLDLLIVDYLQLVSASPPGGKRYENRTQEVSAISRELKALAKELHVPLIAISQLSRAPENRGTKDSEPRLSDLRESGSIEQDADVVGFIYRPEMYERDNESVKGVAKLLIAKQRNGPTDTIQLAFLREFTRFETLDRAMWIA